MTVSFIFNFLKLTPLWEVSLYIQVQIIYIIHLKGTESALYWQSFDFLTVFLHSSERNKIGNFHQDESFSWINYIIWMMNFRQMFGKLILYLFLIYSQGTSTEKDFYKKNHRWTEGLLSAAKAVGWGATALM